MSSCSGKAGDIAAASWEEEPFSPPELQADPSVLLAFEAELPPPVPSPPPSAPSAPPPPRSSLDAPGPELRGGM